MTIMRTKTADQQEADDRAAALWKQFAADPENESLRNQLVEHYLFLVKNQAWRIWSTLPESIDVEDLISAGTFGLLDAIRNFDVSRGLRFETYCPRRIHGAIVDGLREMDWVPRLVRSRSAKLRRVVTKLEHVLGRAPEAHETARVMECTPAEVDVLSREADTVKISSLFEPVETEENYEYRTEFIKAFPNPRGEQPGVRCQAEDAMRSLLRGMNRRERLLVILYYWENLSMKQIGELLDLSESRVSQLHDALLKRQRQRLKDKPGV